MGNKHSSEQPEQVGLPLDAVALRDVSPLVRASTTKLSAEYVDGVAFLVHDQATGELLFTLDDHWDFDTFDERLDFSDFSNCMMLVDSKGKPVAIMETKYALSNRFLIKSPHRPYHRLYEIVSWSGYEKSGLRVRFTDESSGEKLLVEAENNYEERKSALWLTRGDGLLARKRKNRLDWREAMGTITLQEDDCRYEMEVEPNVDLTIAALCCAMIHFMRRSDCLFRDVEDVSDATVAQ